MNTETERQWRDVLYGAWSSKATRLWSNANDTKYTRLWLGRLIAARWVVEG